MYLAILVAALGYFVDVYDLILFSVVRVSSLKDLGVQSDDLLTVGVSLINAQMFGLLLGGVLWGVLGDRYGRISVLFGSILLYSIANIANSFVDNIFLYGLCRFVAGIGLAGELGAGITLVTELMPKETRGYGTMIVASVGLLGAVAASLVGELTSWRTSYVIGGVMGLLLLVLRVGVAESGMFESIKSKEVKRGDLLLFFKSAIRVKKYLCCLFIGLPIMFAIWILVTFMPEIAKELQLLDVPVVGTGIFYVYIGLVLGDVASGIVSQLLKSRKKVIAVFLLLTTIPTIVFLSANGKTASYLYYLCLPLGFTVGYWAVFVTTAAEQFGTNLRATVATSIPNFARGAVVPITLTFNMFKQSFGIIHSAYIIYFVLLSIAFLALLKMEETFSKDLNFVEE